MIFNRLNVSRFVRTAAGFLAAVAIFVGSTPVSLAQKGNAAKKAPPAVTPAPVQEKPKVNPLQDFADKVAARPALKTGRVGILIENLSTGEILADVDSTKLFQPASNMKVYTTATGLDVLGPNFTVRTSVYAAQPDPQGVVAGDLVLFGRGDPTIAPRFNEKDKDETLTPLERLADQVAAAGVKKITGDIVGDESYFRAAPLGDGWEWNDLQWYYGTEISALTVADNNVTLTINAGKAPGEPVTARLNVQLPNITISNHAVTGPAKSEDTFGIHRGLSDNVIDIYGSLPAGKGMEQYISVHDPALFAAHLFKAMLAKRGIEMTGGVRREDANSRARNPLDMTKVKEIAGIDSLPLSRWVDRINKISFNLYAELLLRQIGKQKGPQDKDADVAGTEVVAQFLKKVGVDPASVKLRDGSGLSRLDNISPSSTVKLLKYMRGHQHWQIFYDSLPIASKDGTLRGRMKGTPAAENLRAKTGTLDDVSSLSGYVTAANGDLLVFSILMNNLNRARAEGVTAGNDLGAAMASYKGPAGGAAPSKK
jgi:D-alanyl-D-alanine carboxypeptidase/D-alanyl-D-alanine-endopeptidase (penicillin-binding protein 4)